MEKMPTQSTRTKEIKDLRNKFLDDLEAAGKHDAIQDVMFKDIVEYSDKMEGKYSRPYMRRVRAYHVLIGSTVDMTNADIEDLEGEDSVRNFLGHLREKYLGDK